MLKLQLPVKDVYVTQPFGVNFLDFYKKLGLKGHNGVDFRTKRGCPVLATHDGLVAYAGKDGGGGISVTLQTDGYKTIYYHLLSTQCKKGERYKAGEVIGLADNTGKYTTADHLHFALKEVFINGATMNYGNGYAGAIDPTPYFPKNWDKNNAYHRYGRKQQWYAEHKMRFLNPWLHKKLIKLKKLHYIYNTSFINKLVYGGWSFDMAINPAMNDITAYLKKDEFKNKVTAFKR